MKTQIQIQRCGFGSKDERPAVGLVFVALLLALFLETCLLSPSPSPRLCRPRNGLTGWWWWWLAAMRLSKTYPNNNRGINNVCVRRRWLFLPDRLRGIATVEMIGSMGIRLCIWSPLQGLNTIDNWDQVHSQEWRWPEIANLGVSYWLIGRIRSFMKCSFIWFLGHRFGDHENRSLYSYRVVRNFLTSG